MSSLQSHDVCDGGDTIFDDQAPLRPARPVGSQYAGPERRQSRMADQSPFQELLEEIDYGVLLLGARAELRHANHPARVELSRGDILTLNEGRLQPRQAQDTTVLQEALTGAARRGKRCLIKLGPDTAPLRLSLVPLRVTSGVEPVVAGFFGRQQLCEQLSIEWFARVHGLTLAETRVLSALSRGFRAKQVAELNAVEMSTIRTQVGSIRAKVDAPSLADLMQRLAMLPPLRGALRAEIR